MDPSQEEMTQVDETAAQPKRNVELFLGIVVALMLAVAAIPGVKQTPKAIFDDPTVRGFEGLLLLARDEAIQTGDDHIVFFEAVTLPVSDEAPLSKQPMAWVIRDRDGDGRGSPAEYVASVPADSSGSVEWGTRFATHPAIGDVAHTLSGPLSFDASKSSGQSAGLVFRKDGGPVVNGTSKDPDSVTGTGAGTVYLRTLTRDYAVVLSPWGDVDVQVWDNATASWQIADAN